MSASEREEELKDRPCGETKSATEAARSKQEEDAMFFDKLYDQCNVVLLASKQNQCCPSLKYIHHANVRREEPPLKKTNGGAT